MNRKKPQSLTIRNSTAEFLIFTQQAGEGGIEVRHENETVWLTQKLMAELFATSVDSMGLHLRNIYLEGELQEEETTKDFSVVQKASRRRSPSAEVWRSLPGYLGWSVQV